MYEKFKAKAEGVSAEVYRFGTKADGLAFIVRFLHQEGLADAPQAHAVWAECPFLERIDQRPLLKIPGLKFEITRDLAETAKFGISQVEWALADTGTLVQDSSAVEQRLVSSLPGIHIALTPTANILADMPTLLTRVHPKDSAYIAMITGASRTADIERVLTIGVHGPERLVIVFVDELEGANQ
ncbi:MAG TPA: lactate utilization protein [Desulfuromonadaceae bacterium]|jgi:L-lactate dehydrogenase complex protein LldG